VAPPSPPGPASGFRLRIKKTFLFLEQHVVALGKIESGRARGECRMFSGNSRPGLLLLDKSLGTIASNQEAIRILTYPNFPERMKRIDVFLADKIRAGLVTRQSSNGLDFVKEFKSGKRKYFCRSFLIDSNGKGVPLLAALLFERSSSGTLALEQIGHDFELTQREKETVVFLIQGLTSKEIATRMKISPNTVKAFLRIVMVKMGVSTRSGILGKVIGPGG
jgi:DNA-binding CsgD family transcriptional regulator